MKEKIIIYQLFPRLFTNSCDNRVPNGTIEINGSGKMNSFTPKVLAGIKDLGATHIWYTGVIAHAQKTDYSKYGLRKDNPNIVKGQAGSPYAIKDYYDIDPDIAESVPDRMTEFENLVERTHDARMKVIIDFVPNHVSRQYFSIAKPSGISNLGENDVKDMGFLPSNNFYYIPRQLFAPRFPIGDYYEFPAKATGNDCFSAFPEENDWYETVKLNYGVDYSSGAKCFNPIPDTWYKMLSILRFWASKGVDGFRCDMAFMVPIEFWNWAIPQIKCQCPHIIFIAEIYDVSIYRDFIFNGHFDYLYDKVGLYDTLYNVQVNNYSAATITNCWQAIDGIGNRMLNFLENHDEIRIASDKYLTDPFKAIPALAVSLMISSAPFLIYQGQELGESGMDNEGFAGDNRRTTIFDYWSMKSVSRWYNAGDCGETRLTPDEKRLRKIYKTLIEIAKTEKAIVEGEFFDVMYVNYENPHFYPHSNYAFLRVSGDDIIMVVANFGSLGADLKINIPLHAFEILGMTPGNYKAVDLVSKKKNDIYFSPDTPLPVYVEGYNTVILKLAKKNQKKR